MEETLECKLLIDKNGNHFYPATAPECVIGLNCEVPASALSRNSGTALTTNSIKNSNIMNLILSITGITTTANTDLKVATINATSASSSYPACSNRPKAIIPLIVQTSDNVAAHGYINTNGEIYINTATALSGATVDIIGNYFIQQL